ncbi:MAG: hypothetical protein R3335_07260 [Anaerolineales bacterium]|nr:hypothetical protein [Anaerolineales bacterium]
MDELSGRNQWVIIGALVLTIAAAALVPIYLVFSSSDAETARVAGAEAFNTPTPSPTDAGPLVIEDVSDGLIGGPTRSLDDPNNCVFAPSYWETRPDAWPIEGMQIGGLALDKDQATDMLLGRPGDSREALFQQLVVYALNVNRGADPTVVRPVIRETIDWIERYGEMAAVPLEALTRGQELAEALLQFNTGLTGPGICPDITDTPTPPPTQTPTATPSASPSPTNTFTPPPPPPVIPTSTSSGPGGGNPNPPTNPPPPPTNPPPNPAATPAEQA